MKRPELSTTKEIAIAQIARDPALQQRSGRMDEEYATELCDIVREAQEEGDGIVHPLPPVKVVWDGEVFWLWDGYHTVHAYEANNLPAIIADIYIGDYDGAVILSYGANPGHGLRRTRADKKKAVIAALGNPHLSDATHMEIAEVCGVSREFVWRVNKELDEQPPLPSVKPNSSPAESGNEMGFTEDDVTSELSAAEEENSEAAWVNKIPALAFINLHYGEVPEEALEMARTWRALGSTGLWNEIKRKRSAVKSIAISNPILDAFFRLHDVQTPDKWGVCPECRGSGQDERTYQVCSRCCGGVVLTGGLTP